MVSEILVGGHTLRSDHIEVGQLAREVATDANMLVGLMIHGVEHQGNDSGVVGEERHWHILGFRGELLEEINEPFAPCAKAAYSE